MSSMKSDGVASATLARLVAAGLVAAGLVVVGLVVVGLVVVGLAVVGLAGCSTPAAIPADESARARGPVAIAAPEPAPVASPPAMAIARYGGRLPCADCEGIHVLLTLHSHGADGNPGRYALRETHVRGSDDRRTVVTAGRWTMTRGTPSDEGATVYELHPDDGGRARSFLKVSDNELTALDENRQPLPQTVPGTLMRLEESET
jgi:hypothetical protein